MLVTSFQTSLGLLESWIINNNHNLLDREVVLMNEQLSLKFKNDVKVARF